MSIILSCVCLSVLLVYHQTTYSYCFSHSLFIWSLLLEVLMPIWDRSSLTTTLVASMTHDICSTFGYTDLFSGSDISSIQIYFEDHYISYGFKTANVLVHNF